MYPHSSRPTLTRRHFLHLAASSALTLPTHANPASPPTPKTRFGVITDVHQDVMHDGTQRLGAFIEAMTIEKVDFIVQLGDFCVPHERNRPFLDTWKRFTGPAHHVLGNHDMDGGVPRETTTQFLGMPARHYHFDRGGFRFIVLDGNDPGGGTRGYARFIAPPQLAWLDETIAHSPNRVIILIHQPLEGSGGIVNAADVRAVLTKHTLDDKPKTAAVFSGHCHQDYVRRIDGIPHAQINSASYVWLPANTRQKTYDDALHAKHPYLDHVAAYKDPLWAIVTLDPANATITVQGRQSAWHGPDPWQRGATEKEYPREIHRPAISEWTGPFHLPT